MCGMTEMYENYKSENVDKRNNLQYTCYSWGNLEQTIGFFIQMQRVDEPIISKQVLNCQHRERRKPDRLRKSGEKGKSRNINRGRLRTVCGMTEADENYK